MDLQQVKDLLSRVEMNLLGHQFYLRVDHDQKNPGGRVFLQVYYEAICTRTGKEEQWSGRKFYLSEHMLPDEVIKTAWVAFEAAVKHEVMEGFTVDDKILFNPHVNFEELLKISHKEVQR